MSRINLQHFRQKLEALERATRAIKSELDYALANDRPSSDRSKKTLSIGSGLAEFMAAGERIVRRTVAPYEYFSPGLCCAYASEARGTKIEIENVTFAGQDKDGVAHTSSLFIVSPKFNPDNMTRWCTIETDINYSELIQVSDLNIDALISFGAEGLPRPANFAVQLRLISKTGHHDYYACSYPAISTPINFSYRIDSARFSGLPLNDFSRAVLLINLPVTDGADYDTFIHYFDIRGAMAG